jgi:hypothetical protein
MEFTMRLRKKQGLIFLISIAVAVTTAIGALRRVGPQVPSRAERQQIDKASWPVTDFAVPPEANPEKAAKRIARGKKHNKSDFRVHPDDPSENTTLVDAIDRTLPGLPTKQSTAVLIGTVVASQAFLSDDKSGVYSEFVIRVNDVFKSDSPSLVTGCLTEVERRGGRVKFSSGRIHWYSVDKENMPVSGRQYVFFLIRETQEDSLKILTAYELRGGNIFPLDDLSQFRVFEGKSEEDFMNALRAAVANASESQR